MIRIVFILCILVSLSRKEPVRYDWKHDKQLTWVDFKGKPDRRSPFAASTSSGLSHNYAIDSNGFLVKKQSVVNAYFYPQKSWYKKEMIAAQTLKHEQTHFDITELYARILRKRIAEYDFTSRSLKEIKKIYRDTENERRQLQTRFDQETDHSLNTGAEHAWEIKVQRLLTQYRSWAKY